MTTTLELGDIKTRDVQHDVEDLFNLDLNNITVANMRSKEQWNSKST